ncbi:Putative protein-S-isoprenylcysteine methyltransferase [Olavius sp. associated proteobacterium Delta 1]|nr:Putative protein-S-isoprenylcysteine methyltransferase [Olavius sp. associated proteobacterium Delta 1]
MRTFDELWISSIIGVLIFTSPLLLLKIHSDYKKIAELSKIGVVFAFILFSLFGMAIVNTALFTRWVFAPDNILYKVFGYAFMLIGLIIMAEAFVEFRSFKRVASLKADKVISTGVYRFSRNPQYLAYYLLLIGFSFPHRSVFAFILILIHIIFVEVIFISGEERYLEKSLGDEYLQYKKRVRRWI